MCLGKPVFDTQGQRGWVYSEANITLYIYLLIYHVPKFLCDNTGMKIFMGQGVKRTNDVVRSIYHKKCNKLDSCKDSLLALKRLDYLADHKKNLNIYNKHNDQYWMTTIFEKRRKFQPPNDEGRY